jgi:hypothetical protein
MVTLISHASFIHVISHRVRSYWTRSTHQQ